MKPWYKKFKLMVWLVSIIINGLTLFVRGLSPEVIAFISSVVIGAVALTTQHTITDTQTAISEMTIKKSKFKN